MTEELLSAKEAAEYLKVSPSTLQAWRFYGKHLDYIKPAGKVYYRKSDLDAFLNG